MNVKPSNGHQLIVGLFSFVLCLFTSSASVADHCLGQWQAYMKKAELLAVRADRAKMNKAANECSLARQWLQSNYDQLRYYENLPDHCFHGARSESVNRFQNRIASVIAQHKPIVDKQCSSSEAKGRIANSSSEACTNMRKDLQLSKNLDAEFRTINRRDGKSLSRKCEIADTIVRTMTDISAADCPSQARATQSLITAYQNRLCSNVQKMFFRTCGDEQACRAPGRGTSEFGIRG